MNSKKDQFVTEIAETGTSFTYKGVDPNANRRECLCGCTQQVVKKAIYRPGHDARHVSQLAIFIVEAVEAGKGRSLGKMAREAFATLQSERLVIKLSARLQKSLSESQAETIGKAARERIEDLAEDEEDGEE